MYQGHRIGAVLLMGGMGSRCGSGLPKQFQPLGDKRVYLHTLEAFYRLGLFDEIVLVCHPDWVETVRREAPAALVTLGGPTRQSSSFLGLQRFSIKPDIVSIHDAVRPFVSSEILLENIRMAIQHGAVNTCIPSTDTLVYSPKGQTIESIPVREEYLRGQTPQTFRYAWILEAHLSAIQEKIENASDDCRLILRQGKPVHIVRGSEENFKITTARDLEIANLRGNLKFHIDNFFPLRDLNRQNDT